MKSHSLLSPSTSHRWLVCTPSAKLEEFFPSSTTSYADEGTLAHRLAELLVRNHFKLIKKFEYETELKKVKANQLYNADMLDHCTSYLDFIIEQRSDLQDPFMLLEESLDLEEYVPDGYGTSDCILIADHILIINDFKYGKGVLVEAKENFQMMLYALGALKKLHLLYHIDKVRMIIYQPRIENYSSFEIPANELFKWGDQFVKPQAKKAFEGKGEYVAGEHCKFCKARNSCKTLADYNMELAKFAFEDPNKITDQDMAFILTKGPELVSWFSEVKEHALKEAVVNGKKWPGFKLVEGRSVRKYVDEQAIIKALKKAKYDPVTFMTVPELVGIGTLEKNLGKAEVEKYAGAYIMKPPGSATLVPDWDKRPELGSAEAAKQIFENIKL